MANIRSEVIKNQIGLLRQELKAISQKCTKMRNKIREKLTYLEYMLLMSRLNRKCRSDSLDTQQRHQRKLSALWKSQRTPAPDCLINLSDRKLTIEEENVLRLGLKHHILPRNVNETQVKSNVEKLWQYAKKTIVSGIDSSTESSIRDDLRHSTQSFLNSAKNRCNTKMNQNFHKTLSNLKKDNSIKVCAYDQDPNLGRKCYRTAGPLP